MRNFDIIPMPARPQPAPLQPRKKSRRGPLAVALIVAASAVGLYIFLPQASIQIKARTEPVARDFEIRVNQSSSGPSSAELTVPGAIIEKEVFGEKKFTATGLKNAGKTASGFVTIYNFSKTTLILKKDTTVLTAGNRKYYFTQDVSGIRPTARIGQPEDEEIDEGSLIPPVPLVAAGPGEEFNLARGARLEIQNEAFGAQPKLLYALVAENISGGTTKNVKFVTESDIDSGYAALARELLDQSRSQLSEGNAGVRILDNAFTMQILEQHSAQPVGTEIQEFQVNVKAKIRALSFDETAVRQIIFERIKRLLPEQKILSEHAASLDLKFATVNLEAGQGVLQVHFEGAIVYRLDEEDMREKVLGKSTEEIRELFLSKPEIDSLEVQFSPFWVQSAPKLRSRVRIDMEG